MPDRKFDTSDQRLLTIWDALQCVQSEFCFAQEVAAYYTSASWLGARTVLDVGTGNGMFLQRIAGLFPEKTYCGIDVAAELVSLARMRAMPAHSRFDVCDYFAASGAYDIVIMRLFWQHIDGDRVEDALNTLRRLTRRGSSVVISDAYDEARCFVPDLPLFRQVIAEYSASQQRAGRQRGIVARILEWAQQSHDWQVGAHLALTMPSSIPGYLQLYRRVYELWLDLFEYVREPKIDLTAARAELRDWSTNDAAFTQAGLHVVRLDRIV